MRLSTLLGLSATGSVACPGARLEGGLLLSVKFTCYPPVTLSVPRRGASHPRDGPGRYRRTLSP